MIYAERIVPRLSKIFSGHFQNTPNIKTFFGYVATVEFKFRHVSVLQVTKVIKKLVNIKANGIFGIPKRALEDCADNIAPSLAPSIFH